MSALFLPLPLPAPGAQDSWDEPGPEYVTAKSIHSTWRSKLMTGVYVDMQIPDWAKTTSAKQVLLN